jgi:4-amino-4-deoxychorismate lyase
MLQGLCNGEPADTLALNDRALHYGDGVFETMHAHAGRVPLLARHLARLQLGCERLGIDVPEQRLLVREITSLAALPEVGVIKLIVSRGGGPRGYRPTPAEPTRLLLAYEASPLAPACYRAGIALAWCKIRLGLNPRLAGIKHLNRLEQVLAQGELSQTGCEEGLMCDADGRLVCATAANVFARFGAVLATPDLSRCGVAGVARQWLLDECPAEFTIEVRDMLPEELEKADEVFLSNSLRGLLPVASVGERRWPVGAAVRALQPRFSALGIGVEAGA